MRFKFRILSAPEIFGFRHMTFPAYIHRLGRNTLAVGAYEDDIPIGMALCGPRGNSATAELLSLFVDVSHRSCGVGRMLLAYTEDILKKAEIRSVSTVWSETLACVNAFQAVLAKREWGRPRKRMIILRGDMDGDFGREVRDKYLKYQRPDCVPRKYCLTLWSELSEADREFIRSKEGRPGWFEPRANPFREERILEPDNSLVLRKDSVIVGWLTVHRTSPDTLRYTDVFIHENLKRGGAVAIAMTTHGFWLQLAEGTPKLTMATEVENEALVQFYHKRMSCSQLSWTWGAEKALS